MRPLEGTVVLDLTHVLSGPYCTMLLADLGARTIKIEPPAGESTRAFFASDPANSLNGMGAYFLTLNRNKESVSIDLKQPDGLELFYALAKKTDVAINNFGPGVPRRLGIDHETLARHNPRIITCSITGFGETGPLSQRPAFDLVAQGMGGGMSITGTPETGPLRAGIPIGDLGGGLFAAIGILTALNARSLTGRGQHVDISMLDAQISLLNYMATMHFLSGAIPHGLGNGHFLHVPYGTFQTKDAWIIIAVLSDKIWARCSEILAAPELSTDEYATQPGRWWHRERLNRQVAEALAVRTCAEWLDIFAEQGIPAAPVNNFAQALSDPQVRARNMIVNVSHPLGGSVQMPGNPIKLSDTSEERFTPPPLLGQQTETVLSGLLELHADRIAELRRTGVVF